MSHPIGFPQANGILERPKGTTKEECSSLEVYRDGMRCISRWQLTDEEIEELKKNGGKLYLWVWMGDTQPPVYVSPQNPWSGEDEPDAHRTDQS